MAEHLTCLFFARVARREVLQTIEFYREDIELLSELGFELRIDIRNHHAVRGRCPDVAYCWWHHSAFPTILAMRLRRVPVLVTGAFHFQDVTSRGWRPLLRRHIGRLAARLATINLALSHSEAQDLRFLPPDRWTVVHPSVDTDFFAPAPETSMRPHGVTIAQLNPDSIRRKGIDLAIRTVSMVRARRSDYELHVVGHATPAGQALLNELTAGIDTTGVNFHGELTREDKRSLLRQSAVYLQPSTFEGFGLAAVEAMACGVPVIHSGAGSLTEVCGPAGIIATRSESNLADAIVNVLSDGHQPELRLAARQQAERFARPIRRAALAALLSTPTGLELTDRQSQAG